MKLTDDEVIALGVRARTPWPGPTPTVDVAEEGALAAAAGRGERSLYVRDLVVDDPADPRGMLDADLERLLTPVFERQVVCSVFLADSELNWYPAGLNVVYYRTPDDQCLVESVSSGGVHELGPVPREVALGSVAELAAAAWVGGVRIRPEAEPTESLCIATVRGEDAPLVLQVAWSSAVVRPADDRNIPEERTLDRAGVNDFIAALASRPA